MAGSVTSDSNCPDSRSVSSGSAPRLGCQLPHGRLVGDGELGIAWEPGLGSSLPAFRLFSTRTPRCQPPTVVKQS